MTDLTDAFNEFHDKLELPDSAKQRIDSAWERLEDHIREHTDASGDDVFLQGSFPNGTAVRPVDGGEYDVDSCAVIINEPGLSSDAAFAQLEEVLAEDADYAKRMDTDPTRCIRLDYADDPIGAFHVDVVAARPSGDHLEIPVRGDGWCETNPAGFTDWCLGRPALFHRIVRMLKRWRDNTAEGTKRGVKSIVLQVLVDRHLPTGDSDDAMAVAAVLRGMSDEIEHNGGRKAEVVNPSLETEDLTSTWPDDDFNVFRAAVAEASLVAEQAQAALTAADAHELWIDLFGDAFPPAPNADAESGKASAPAPVVVTRPRREASRQERHG